jgi:hypothetical protein
LAGIVVPVKVLPAIHLSAAGALVELATVVAAVGVTAAVSSGLFGRARSAGPTLVQSTIRRLHDGSIGDSATWVTVGTATAAAVLALGLH